MESYFQVAIPDPLAESIATVGELAAAVTQLRGLLPAGNRTAAHARLLDQVLRCLQAGFPAATAATPLTQLGLLESGQPVRQQLADCLSLKLPPVPAPPVFSTPGWLYRLLGTDYVAPAQPHWTRATLPDFIDWLLAAHYRVLLPAPATLYEVQRAVIGLTADKCGLPIVEIQLTDRFTSDLGID
ncbi:hypothetical protein [Hymenobacter rubripertinctus]|uniref:Uncharacterized protein n=1 Tax=Hymenobacter rubripertinctus TaxID=2029981 RepID=A0A418QIK1_9BACT|nr:hypothetical protein [Hymenobacter rubripertinctus]RIY04988.1 hypothetical protein D0T11_21120 [Hymenobacter rubripertinctus]